MAKDKSDKKTKDVSPLVSEDVRMAEITDKVAIIFPASLLFGFQLLPLALKEIKKREGEGRNNHPPRRPFSNRSSISAKETHEETT